MRQESEPDGSAERHVKEIRRKTRRKFSAEEKIRIVLEGLRGEYSIAELCRREGIAQGLYYTWSKEFLEAGKRRLSGDTERQATSGEVSDLKREMRDLKEVVADLTLENRILKKSVTGDGEDIERDTPPPRSLGSSGWSSNRTSRSRRRWSRPACRVRPFTDGMICIAGSVRLLSKTGVVALAACGTASRMRCVSRCWKWPWISRLSLPGSWR